MTTNTKRSPKGRSGRRRPTNARKSNRKKGSDLDPRRCIKAAKPIEEKKFVSQLMIKDLPVDDRIVERLIKKGFERPTEIQEKTLLQLLDGKNMLGIAQTGTGKTGAFLIPVIQQLLDNKGRKSHALVVVPTRELAIQVNEEFRSMTQGLRLFSACFIGGTNINKDVRELRRESHLVVATPGRLLDLQQRRSIDLRRFSVLILDEFDRMLDMGFARDVDRIINLMPNRKHTMLFSATLDHKQRDRINEILEQHEVVQVATGQTTTDRVDQDILVVDSNEDRYQKLVGLLNQDEFKKVIVFSETKHQVNRLTAKLNKANIPASQIQGNKSQNARQRALNDFKNGKVRVLVATDVAGRGIDVEEVTHVINYFLPMTYDSYIHRIGRTGRAGKTGTALTFVSSDNPYLKQDR